MIRRARRTFISTDITNSQHSPCNETSKDLMPSRAESEHSKQVYNGYPFSTKFNINRKRRRKTSKQYWSKLFAAIAGGFLFCYLITYYKLSQYFSKSRLLNSSISTKNYTLVLSKQSIRPHKFAVPVSQIVFPNGFDFGGLDLRFLEDEAFRLQGRLIYHDFYEDTGYSELWDTADDDGDVDSYYAFDDDEKRNPFVMYDDPDIHLRKKCRRTKWHRESPITCNTIHEFDFQNHVQLGDTNFLGYVSLKVFQ
jgi:hypothetical protein